MASAKIGRDGVVAEAIALMNECGLTDVSLRKLATRLNVRAPSLARHVGDKASLQAQMLDSILKGVVDQLQEATWEAWLLNFGRGLWQAHREIRDLAMLFAVTPHDPGTFRDFGSGLERVLHGFEVSQEEAAQPLASVFALITGWAIYNQNIRPGHSHSLVDVDKDVERGLVILATHWNDGVRQRVAKPGRRA